MADVQVNRCRKYGKDRVYINTVDGVRIGWLNLAPGDRVIERPLQLESCVVALAC